MEDEKTPDRPSDVMKEQILKKEGERMNRYIRDDAYKIALAIEGKRWILKGSHQKSEDWE